MDEIATLVGGLGFPIVCCIFMWKYINTTMREFNDTMKENTKMLHKLCDRLDMFEEGDDE